MLSFVTGTLEKNEAEADMGNVFLRWLTIRLADNTLMKRIFDDDVISSSLEIGKTYEFVLLVRPPRPVLAEKCTVQKSLATWSGVIVNTAWPTSQLHYQYMRADVPNKNLVLIESPLGHVVSTMLLLRRHATSEPVVGNLVTWNKDHRMDLLAVNEVA